MKKIFSRPKSLKKAVFHYCAGCGHSITHRLIAEVIDELNIQDRTIGIPPAGCAVIAYNYFDFDMLEAPHGRGCAVATGMKRVLPDRVIFSYQGDGDLAAIGTAETLHAANRGENITVIFINNAVYGMTGGQMAPTTLLGQVSTTTPPGRTALLDGHPIHLSEILGHLPGTSYIERCAVNTPVNIVKAKKAIKKAFQNQLDGIGFSLVEILSQCPTNWKMTPVDACRWVKEVMAKEFPLGVIKDITTQAGDK
ncbi:MAG TPA: thiamine pyrophosphate-dependent enzyme [Syntrophales bacterium]|jgi:2-oxoglutarate ferredoxin oxidoreductase subunit beta|nr:thiamine pyrophosphate-dependent enzyme [Syntrophales bacterium]HON23919.1 thiamine pyrophosphate-dependent enzyme [Syntrophales bacterium]HOU78522.1 thiamine pyrophosphate-dependent enzyme [Syntrophales bacterium]HPC31605.1 thiamine pyrophosphate-dependent enzyme [Syntrophales bacterium]HQG35453.1 thiamine pyrophosphate-dependent enzyme [Syntrophales bacterium]